MKHLSLDVGKFVKQSASGAASPPDEPASRPAGT